MYAKIGFITGTGFYSLPGVEETKSETVETPFGEIQVELGLFHGTSVAFIPRHGKSHSVAPADINVRANIFALYSLGVEYILATSVSGSIEPSWSPGSLVIVDQFLNFTNGRKESFYPLDGKIAHIDVGDPYCPTIREALLSEAQRLGIRLEKGGVYACTNGPRFESKAEIEMIRRLGGNLVGHTNFPENILARELAICYATVGVVSNYAAGVKSTELTATEIKENISASGEEIAHLFAATIEKLPEKRDDICCHALDEAFL